MCPPHTHPLVKCSGRWGDRLPCVISCGAAPALTLLNFYSVWYCALMHREWKRALGASYHLFFKARYLFELGTPFLSPLGRKPASPRDPPCLSVVLLWRDTKTRATLTKEHIEFGLAYSFEGLVHWQHGGERGRHTCCHGAGEGAGGSVLELREARDGLGLVWAFETPTPAPVTLPPTRRTSWSSLSI